jgi:hypothetical protein
VFVAFLKEIQVVVMERMLLEAEEERAEKEIQMNCLMVVGKKLMEH